MDAVPAMVVVRLLLERRASAEKRYMVIHVYLSYCLTDSTNTINNLYEKKCQLEHDARHQASERVSEGLALQYDRHPKLATTTTVLLLLVLLLRSTSTSPCNKVLLR